MSNSVLNDYCMDMSFKSKGREQQIYVTTVLGLENITFNINSTKDIKKCEVEELFILIKDNFKEKLKKNLGLLNNIKSDKNINDSKQESKMNEDVSVLYLHLFVDNIANVKRLIEGRWLRDCNKGRIYCGEYLDLAIAPQGGIYQNSVTINSAEDLGSWAEMFSLDSLKNKSAKEVYNSIIFELDYAQWVYSKDKVLELAKLFVKQYESANTTDVTTSILIALTGLLADEEKLDRLIGSSLTVEAKDLLDKIIKGTNAIIDCGVSNSNSKIIDKMEIF